MEATILQTVDKNGRVHQFYNSDRDIHGDTRVKTRVNGYDFVWQYVTKDDYDGVIMNKCIAIDEREWKDLLARGVKFYECRYAGGVRYRISLEKFQQWAHPVVGKFGNQLCVSWRHWDTNETDELKPKRNKKKLTKVIPLRAASAMVQGSLFEVMK